MIVCDKRELIFFHIPKTAGSFIERSLCKQLGISAWETEWFSDNTYMKHMKPKMFYKRFPEKKHYATFSCSRNPWDYALSFYSMLTQWPKFASIRGHEMINKGRIHPMNDFADFNEFIEAAYEGVGPEQPVRRLRDTLSNPITRFLTKGKVTKDAKLWADHIIRFENLQDDINRIFPQIGLEPIDCNVRDSSIPKNADEPKDCSSKHDHYTEVYSDKAREIIRELNHVDLSRFNYAFGK